LLREQIALASDWAAMEAPMDIKALAREFADLRFSSGYTFENGTPFYEALNAERAEALLTALLDRGYIVSHREVQSPSIQESGQESGHEQYDHIRH
jgi:hypothetical protein